MKIASSIAIFIVGVALLPASKLERVGENALGEGIGTTATVPPPESCSVCFEICPRALLERKLFAILAEAIHEAGMSIRISDTNISAVRLAARYFDALGNPGNYGIQVIPQ